ncbi:MAG: hypothetical protein HN341_04245 [Verrucomicrobia bacterium]|jgi:hypothetical protein|nr:hypothetical protein [Verrucomicrobiota bacterium]
MPVFPCEHCGGAYELSEADVGSTVLCPHCQKETTSTPAPQVSGAAAMAQDLTQRMATEQAARKQSPVTWILPTTALVITALVHAIMAAIHMTFMPMPNVLVFWLPAAIGSLSGLYLFTLFTRSSNVDCPKWAAPVALFIAVVLSVIPILIVQQRYNMKVRRALIAQVDALVKAPSLPAETAVCINATVPEPTGDGNFVFTATLEDGAMHELVSKVSLYEADLVYEDAMKALQVLLALPHIERALETCLKAYPHLALLEMQPLESVVTPETGTYTGDATFTTGLKLSFVASVRKTDMSCQLKPESDLRANAIPLAAALWKRFEPASEDVCADVELGDSIDDTHRQANAVLTNGQGVPLIIEQLNVGGDTKTLSVFFQFRENAIMEINEVIVASAADTGRETARRCVNIDEKEELRKHEYSLRALFPEGEPLMVLAREHAYSVGIVIGEHEVMLPPKARKVGDSWSLVIPSHYVSGEGGEFVRTRLSAEDKLRVSLETKPINAYAKFKLEEYAIRERSEWEAGHPGAEIERVEFWKTLSGLLGYRYATRKGTALRIKYFFTHGTNLAILSALSTEAESDSTEKADRIVRSLRFEDVPFEPSALLE